MDGHPYYRPWFGALRDLFLSNLWLEPWRSRESSPSTQRAGDPVHGHSHGGSLVCGGSSRGHRCLLSLLLHSTRVGLFGGGGLSHTE